MEPETMWDVFYDGMVRMDDFYRRRTAGPAYLESQVGRVMPKANQDGVEFVGASEE